jgi:hypothetical protein
VSRLDREHPRYALDATVTFYAQDRAVSGRTRNVSRGGLCATLTEEVPVGVNIEVDLQLVFDEEQRSEPLRLSARVTWCTAIDDQYQVGVQFIGLREDTAADLTMFLRYLHGTAPRREPQAPAALSLAIDDRFG